MFSDLSSVKEMIGRIQGDCQWLNRGRTIPSCRIRIEDVSTGVRDREGFFFVSGEIGPVDILIIKGALLEKKDETASQRRTRI